MLQEVVEVIRQGDESGNVWIVRIPFPSGLEIIGVGTKNFYGGDWDFGPTWNYVVLADKSFLLDTGRVGMGSKLLGMMESSGISIRDVDFSSSATGTKTTTGGYVMWQDPQGHP